jgi:ABC-type Mn2+/Zn2+ transport system permease subunit
MVHLGIDIDQFILLTIYPAAAFFAMGYIAKKSKMRQQISSLLQAAICFAFAVGYLVLVPNGGAQGLAIVLIMFGGVLLFMAKKQAVQQEQSV